MAVSRRTVAVSTAGLVSLVAASGLYLRARGASQGDDRAATQGNSGPPPASALESFPTDVAIPVEGAPVIRDTLVISVTAAGQARAARETKIVAQVAGRVLSVAVRENQPVRGGQLLLVLDSTEYQLALKEANANLLQAQASYEEQMLGGARLDSAARAERARLARAQSGLDQAEAQLYRARMNLEHTRVVAPFPGRVASVMVVEGAWVQTSNELLSVVDIDPIRVEVQVLETEVGLLARGGRAQVTFAALPGETFDGRVATINPMIEEATRTARVMVIVANRGGRVLPGMYARVALEARKFPDRILVPRSAILERDRRPMLFVYEGDERGGLAKWRYVTPGLQNDSLVEIVQHPETEMVRPGEMVLTDGHYTLIHDAPVRLVQSVREAGGRPQ